MTTSEGVPFDDYSLLGGYSRNFPGMKTWTDIRGERITDSKVYWHYANRSDTEKTPFGVWRLRLEHYRVRGEMKLMEREETCNLDFKLHFVAGGANMVGILGVDSQWTYGSNGRMEQEYLQGISAELERRKAATVP
jgi:hypothetical protein